MASVQHPPAIFALFSLPLSLFLSSYFKNKRRLTLCMFSSASSQCLSAPLTESNISN